jgi:hypothetical protein
MPRLLRIAPVDSGQEIAQLRRGDRHCFACNRRPDKPSTFETFRKKTRALTIMPNHFQKIAAFPPEAEQMA